jgi:hypothetical protein
MIIKKTSIGTYVGLTIVFVVSVSCAYFLPINEIFKNIATMPAAIALVAVIYQLLRDQAAFERQDYLQRQQQIFNLATASHMANVAFDKHAEFCEKYMGEVHETVGDLSRKGPRSPKVKDHLKNFISLKREYAAWVPKDVAVQLEPFENKLQDMSLQADIADDYEGQPGNEKNNAVNAIHEVYLSVWGIGKTDTTKDDQNISVEDIKERIRLILGINDLTTMRKLLVSEAIRFLKGT